jgi:hypothetical protein
MSAPVEKYFADDIGRALTAAQMDEYREAHEALAAGVDLKALRWASNVGITLLVAIAVIGFVTSL